MGQETFDICLTDGYEIFKIRRDVTRKEWHDLNERAYEATDGNILWDEMPDDRTLDGTGNMHLIPNH